jgi:hypothetical protein
MIRRRGAIAEWRRLGGPASARSAGGTVVVMSLLLEPGSRRGARPAARPG